MLGLFFFEEVGVVLILGGGEQVGSAADSKIWGPYNAFDGFRGHICAIV